MYAIRSYYGVDSAVIRLIPRAQDELTVRDEARFAELVAAAFGQRRKSYNFV